MVSLGVIMPVETQEPPILDRKLRLLITQSPNGYVNDVVFALLNDLDPTILRAAGKEELAIALEMARGEVASYVNLQEEVEKNLAIEWENIKNPKEEPETPVAKKERKKVDVDIARDTHRLHGGILGTQISFSSSIPETGRKRGRKIHQRNVYEAGIQGKRPCGCEYEIDDRGFFHDTFFCEKHRQHTE